jgi:hypothetical protein
MKKDDSGDGVLRRVMLSKVNGLASRLHPDSGGFVVAVRMAIS